MSHFITIVTNKKSTHTCFSKEKKKKKNNQHILAMIYSPIKNSRGPYRVGSHIVSANNFFKSNTPTHNHSSHHLMLIFLFSNIIYSRILFHFWTAYTYYFKYKIVYHSLIFPWGYMWKARATWRSTSQI